MEIININNISSIPTAATIGSFDGVHCGHVAMIEETKQRAVAVGLPVTLITFSRHPRIFFDSSSEPFLLTSSSMRMERLAATGADRCVVLDFDTRIAKMSAWEFMKKVLVECLNVKLLVLGYDHRFGCRTSGEDMNSYLDYGHKLGVNVVRAAIYEKEGMKVSSSQVRRALAIGDVEHAAILLGYPYYINGTVVHGEALGRKLGFPTANILLDEPMQLLPENGVYEAVANVKGKECKGVVNIGVKPTVSNEGKRTVELFVVDFSDNLYGENIGLSFVRRIREERRFSSLEELKIQIKKDVDFIK